MKPQDYIYPNRPVHKLEMGFPFPLPIQSYSFHWKTRDTIRLRLSKYAVLNLDLDFCFYVIKCNDSNSDLIFSRETAENI